MMMSSTMHIVEMMRTSGNDSTTGHGREVAGYFSSAYALRLFSGNRPTREQLQSLVTVTSGVSKYAMSKLPALLATLGGIPTASMTQNAVSPATWLPVAMKPGKIAMEFSQLNLSMSSLSDEAPTWGLVYLFPASVAASPDSWATYSLLYFTVGDTGSGADLIIPGGVIPRFNLWKPNDFEITLAGTVQ